MSRDRVESELQRCQAREFQNGVRCDDDAEEYVDYAPGRGVDPETWVYCSEHAEEFTNKCRTDVVGRGAL